MHGEAQTVGFRKSAGYFSLSLVKACSGFNPAAMQLVDYQVYWCLCLMKSCRPQNQGFRKRLVQTTMELQMLRLVSQLSSIGQTGQGCNQQCW